MAMPLGKRIQGCPLLSVPDGAPTKEVQAAILLSVEYLKVIGPPNRDDHFCSIYGYVRVSDREMDVTTAVTLFDRQRDSPETINLGHPQFQFLTLSDGDSVRPVLGGNPVYVQMKLWEKLEEDDTEQPEGEVEDPVIVEVDFEFDDFYKTNKRNFFEFQGNAGFVFYLAHSHIFGGISAQVQFTLKDMGSAREEEGSSATATTNPRKRRISAIHGIIGATQSINDDELTAIRFFYAPPHEPAQVVLGSPIELSRKQVVALTGGGCLGIAYTLHNAANGKLITANAVPFRIERDAGVVKAPANLTYTQDSDDGLVSVSITLVPHKPCP